MHDVPQGLSTGGTVCGAGLGAGTGECSELFKAGAIYTQLRYIQKRQYKQVVSRYHVHQIRRPR
jgi:hypothetical protein